MAKEEKKKAEEIKDIEELDWDDGIESEISTDEFAILPEGEYDFEVADLEKTFSKAGNKMAKIVLEIVFQGHKYKVFDNMVLMSNMKWKLAQFFECLGLKKKGTELKSMPWNQVVEKYGRVRIKHEEYNGKTNAKVDAYIITAAAQASMSPEDGSLPFEV